MSESRVGSEEELPLPVVFCTLDALLHAELGGASCQAVLCGGYFGASFRLVE